MRPAKKVIEVTAIIEKFSHDGRGIARVDGKTTFIQGALPGETVRFEVLRQKRDYNEGRLLEVLASSPKRVEPKCPHYLLCGGCSLQHIDSATQREIKQTLFLDMLDRIGHCRPQTLIPTLYAADWHYRNKARLSVRYVEKKHAVLVGFREKNNPRYITEIGQCPVLNSRVDAQLMPLRQLLTQLDDPRCMAQIEVAAGDDDIALIFRNMTTISCEDETKLVDFGKAAGFHIYLQPAGPDSVYRLYPTVGPEWLNYCLPEEGVNFSFLPTDFTQINAGLNRLMVHQALQLLDLSTEDVVLDLFCGLGNFTLPIAKRCAFAIGVEGNQAMVDRARCNAQTNDVTNAEFYCANLEDVVAVQTVLSRQVTKVLLDPPRAGAFELVKRMDKLNPQRIVYVSCNPATLARDAGVLVNEHGYVMQKAGVMDMFPHTEHVESIALFTK